MRVAIITATPANVAFGSGTHVAAQNLRNGLVALGHEVVTVAPASPIGSRWFASRRFLFNARLRTGNISACDLVCGFDMDGWMLPTPASVPYVAYLHGVIADEARFERGLTRWSLRVQSWAERAGARRAVRVLAPSEYSARRIGELYEVPAGQTRVVPPGFDVERWQEALDRSPRRTEPGPPAILSVGRMYPRKNHAGLLRAAARLKDVVPVFELRIVGDGPERGRLSRLARELGLKDTVRFLGQVPFGKLAAEYAACDLFCLPSLQEGFGLVFAEAMTAGAPIVACDAGAVPEIVKNGVNGLLSPPGDDDALARDLGRMITDAELRGRIGTTNRAAAPERFGIRPAAGRFINAVEELTACQVDDSAQ